MRAVNTIVILTLFVVAESTNPKWLGYVIAASLLCAYFYVVYLRPRTRDTGPTKIISRNYMPLAEQKAYQVSKHDVDALETEFRAFWNRWTNFPVDSKTQTHCEELARPLEVLLFDLIQRSVNYGSYPQAQSRELGEWLGMALAHLTRGSLMVGLEFPKHDVSYTEGKAFRYRSYASKQAGELLALFVEKLLDDRHISIHEANRIKQEGERLIKDISIACFRVGTGLSPSTKRPVTQ